MSNSNSVYVFDLDDTLADTRSMRDGVAMPIDEKMRMMSAAPALPLAAFAAALSAAGERVIILTARTESDYTREQVARYGIVAEFLFRPDGDHRVDHKVKADHVRDMLAHGMTIVTAWDDKVKNVEMFRSFGIEAVQV